MTETTVEEIFQGACSNVLSNHYLADLQHEAMKFVGPIQFSPDETAFAQKINDSYPKENVSRLYDRITQLDLPDDIRVQVDDSLGQPLLSINIPPLNEGFIGTGSTDVGDVSQITPLSMLRTTCFPTGVAGHDWGIVASSGSTIGHKGMMHAAKIMAIAAFDLYTEPQHLEKATLEFERAMGDQPYQCPIPDHVQPPKHHNPERLSA